MIHLSDSVWYECPLDVTYIISCIYLIDWVLIALLSPGLLYVWEDKLIFSIRATALLSLSLILVQNQSRTEHCV